MYRNSHTHWQLNRMLVLCDCFVANVFASIIIVLIHATFKVKLKMYFISQYRLGHFSPTTKLYRKLAERKT